MGGQFVATHGLQRAISTNGGGAGRIRDGDIVQHEDAGVGTGLDRGVGLAVAGERGGDKDRDAFDGRRAEVTRGGIGIEVERFAERNRIRGIRAGVVARKRHRRRNRGHGGDHRIGIEGRRERAVLKIKKGGVADRAGSVVVYADLERGGHGTAGRERSVAEGHGGDLPGVGRAGGDENGLGRTLETIENLRARFGGDGDEGRVGRHGVPNQDQRAGHAIDRESEGHRCSRAGIAERKRVGERGAGLNVRGGAALGEDKRGIARGQGVRVGLSGTTGRRGGGNLQTSNRQIGQHRRGRSGKQEGHGSARGQRNGGPGGEAGLGGVQRSITVAVFAQDQGAKVKRASSQIAEIETDRERNGAGIRQRVRKGDEGGRYHDISGIARERKTRHPGGQRVGIGDNRACGRRGGRYFEARQSGRHEDRRGDPGKHYGERGGRGEGDTGAVHQARFGGVQDAVAIGVLAEDECGKVKRITGEVSEIQRERQRIQPRVGERVREENRGAGQDLESAIRHERKAVSRGRRRRGGNKAWGRERVRVHDTDHPGGRGRRDFELGHRTNHELSRSRAAEQQGQRSAGFQHHGAAGYEAAFTGIEQTVSVGIFTERQRREVEAVAAQITEIEGDRNANRIEVGERVGEGDGRAGGDALRAVGGERESGRAGRGAHRVGAEGDKGTRGVAIVDPGLIGDRDPRLGALRRHPTGYKAEEESKRAAEKSRWGEHSIHPGRRLNPRRSKTTRSGENEF